MPHTITLLGANHSTYWEFGGSILVPAKLRFVSRPLLVLKPSTIMPRVCLKTETTPIPPKQWPACGKGGARGWGRGQGGT